MDDDQRRDGSAARGGVKRGREPEATTETDVDRAATNENSSSSSLTIGLDVDFSAMGSSFASGRQPQRFSHANRNRRRVVAEDNCKRDIVPAPAHTPAPVEPATIKEMVSLLRMPSLFEPSDRSDDDDDEVEEEEDGSNRGGNAEAAVAGSIEGGLVQADGNNMMQYTAEESGEPVRKVENGAPTMSAISTNAPSTTTRSSGSSTSQRKKKLTHRGVQPHPTTFVSRRGSIAGVGVDVMSELTVLEPLPFETSSLDEYVAYLREQQERKRQLEAVLKQYGGGDELFAVQQQQQDDSADAEQNQTGHSKPKEAGDIVSDALAAAIASVAGQNGASSGKQEDSQGYPQAQPGSTGVVPTLWGAAPFTILNFELRPRDPRGSAPTDDGGKATAVPGSGPAQEAGGSEGGVPLANHDRATNGAMQSHDALDVHVVVGFREKGGSAPGAKREQFFVKQSIPLVELRRSHPQHLIDFLLHRATYANTGLLQ